MSAAVTRRSFTIEKKLQVVRLAQSTSIKNAVKLHNVDRKCIGQWCRQEKEFEKQLARKGLPGGGQHIPYASIHYLASMHFLII